LLRPNFLGAIRNNKIGDTGSLEIYTRERTILMSPDASRIMTPGPARGTLPYLDRIIAGHNGAEEALDSKGIQTIFASKQLSLTPWVLVGNLPAREAYAPAVSAQNRLAATTFGFAVLAALLTWLGTRYLLAPVTDLRNAIHAMREDDSAVYSADLKRQDELGDLARDFEALIRERALAQDTVLKRESELRKIEMWLRTITDNVPVPIYYVDCEQRYRFVNATLGNWLGIDPSSLIGRTLHDCFSVEEYERIAPHVAAALSGKQVAFERRALYQGVSRDVSTVYIPDVAPDGTVNGFYTLVQDITQSKKLQNDLAHRADHDELTSLPNRALFQDRIARAMELSGRTVQNVALMFLDLDHFKNINDSYGHDAGDKLLKAFAQRLSHCVRTTDTVARLGGDEFTIILENMADVSLAEAIAEKILAAMREPVTLGSVSVEVSTSIGIALATAAECNAADLILRADQALYAAKEKGRDTYSVYGQLQQGTLLRRVK
jgi:diguanylate cyclase (GGDEF)-like protein/PAS domain S-box-containing protein